MLSTWIWYHAFPLGAGSGRDLQLAAGQKFVQAAAHVPLAQARLTCQERNSRPSLAFISGMVGDR